MKSLEKKKTSFSFVRKHFSLLLSIIGLLILICFSLLLIPESQMPTILQSSGLVAIISAFLGVIMTVAVTSILLDKQSIVDQEKNKSMKIFEKKQDIYLAFLEKLQEIIKNDEVKIIKGNDSSSDVDELKDLIFQLGFLQMHAPEESINKIMTELAKIVELMNGYKWKDNESQNKELVEYYSGISKSLFSIISILKSDLYDDASGGIYDEKITEILKKCSLYVELKGVDKCKIQESFWNEIENQLKEKDYKVAENTKIEEDVKNFYNNNKKEVCFGFNTKSGLYITLQIDKKDDFTYGIMRDDDKEGCSVLELIIKSISDSFITNKTWVGFKKPDKYTIDFVNCNSQAYEKLIKPNSREFFVKGLVEEIDRYVSQIEGQWNPSK